MLSTRCLRTRSHFLRNSYLPQILLRISTICRLSEGLNMSKIGNDRPDERCPRFVFFPLSQRPPIWTSSIIEVFSMSRDKLDTMRGLQKRSDEVLAILRPGLEGLNFEVEKGKRAHEKIQRPALFGEMGEPGHKYEIDAYNEDSGIVLEIEAGRAIKGNAIYRDLIQMALMVDAKFAVIAMPISYRHRQVKKHTVQLRFLHMTQEGSFSKLSMRVRAYDYHLREFC